MNFGEVCQVGILLNALLPPIVLALPRLLVPAWL
jgi:hypothetical protein